MIIAPIFMFFFFSWTGGVPGVLPGGAPIAVPGGGAQLPGGYYQAAKAAKYGTV